MDKFVSDVKAGVHEKEGADTDFFFCSEDHRLRLMSTIILFRHVDERETAVDRLAAFTTHLWCNGNPTHGGVFRVAQHSLRSEQNGSYGNDEGDGQKGGCRGARGGCGLLLPRYVLCARLFSHWYIAQCDQIVAQEYSLMW
jgi:hypothetical protein